VNVSVSDTGRGVSAGEVDRVFEAFYSTKTDGIGMGLSICRSIVEAHGGRIWVSAPDSGAGGEFKFTLPTVERTPDHD
jgi:signal transduction histidine kinase